MLYFSSKPPHILCPTNISNYPSPLFPISLRYFQLGRKYIYDENVPDLLEALMTGVMYHRPDDAVMYLRGCLEKVFEVRRTSTVYEWIRVCTLRAAILQALRAVQHR